MARLQGQGLRLAMGARTLCRDLDLAIAAGECWGILGGNGSGKTTLLHTLAGLRPADNGKILLDGAPLAQLHRRTVAQRLGLLLQDSQDPFPASVWETALSGRHPHLGRWQSETPQDHARVRDALATMELGGMEERSIQSLSGGERRRLAIATLLTQDPALLLLDEPLNHLDLRHQQALLQHLRRLCDERDKGVAMVLHDPNQALRYCDRVLLLGGDGTWQAGRCEELLTAETLSQLYGCPIEMLEQDGRRLLLPY
jgi:iron complex transport system ATP-binding protein